MRRESLRQWRTEMLKREHTAILQKAGTLREGDLSGDTVWLLEAIGGELERRATINAIRYLTDMKWQHWRDLPTSNTETIYSLVKPALSPAMRERGSVCAETMASVLYFMFDEDWQQLDAATLETIVYFVKEGSQGR